MIEDFKGERLVDIWENILGRMNSQCKALRQEYTWWV